MEAYAEGFNILRDADAGKRSRPTDAETAPLPHPEYYQYDMDLPEIAEVWRRGSAGRVSDSGEGRWAIAAAIDEAVPVISAALFGRFESRGESDYADRFSRR